MKLATKTAPPALTTVAPEAGANAEVVAALGDRYAAFRRMTSMLLEIRGVDTGFTWGIGRTVAEAIRDAQAARSIVRP